MSVIYVRTNKFNGKQYVGKTTDLKVRQKKWNNLLYRYAGPVINNARAKYGIDAFDFEILKECEDEELNQWEMYYIKELNTKAPNGYNLTDGGEGMTGYTHSEETRKKLSEIVKKSYTEERKQYLREIQKGKRYSEESKQKMSESHKGKKISEETRRKISKANKGENNYMYGKHHTDEVKKKMGKALSKPVLQIDPKTNEVIAEFPSVREVQRELGFDFSLISACCRNKPHYNTAYGYKWQYK